MCGQLRFADVFYLNIHGIQSPQKRWHFSSSLCFTSWECRCTTRSCIYKPTQLYNKAGMGRVVAISCKCGRGRSSLTFRCLIRHNTAYAADAISLSAALWENQWPFWSTSCRIGLLSLWRFEVCLSLETHRMTLWWHKAQLYAIYPFWSRQTWLHLFCSQPWV